jgi:hypothetical protein
MKSRFFVTTEIKNESCKFTEHFKQLQNDFSHSKEQRKIGWCVHRKNTKSTGANVQAVDKQVISKAKHGVHYITLIDIVKAVGVKENLGVKISGKAADMSRYANSSEQRNPFDSIGEYRITVSPGYCPVRCNENLEVGLVSEVNPAMVSEFTQDIAPSESVERSRIAPSRKNIVNFNAVPRFLPTTGHEDPSVLQHLKGILSGLQVVKGAYHHKIDVAVRLAEALEHRAMSSNTLPISSSQCNPHTTEIRDLAKASGFLLIFIRRLSGRLATRVSRERSDCHVTRVARARLCRCVQFTPTLPTCVLTRTTAVSASVSLACARPCASPTSAACAGPGATRTSRSQRGGTRRRRWRPTAHSQTHTRGGWRACGGAAASSQRAGRGTCAGTAASSASSRLLARRFACASGSRRPG